MSTSAAAPLPPLSHLQWRAPEWISAFGPLTRSILMDYFVLSPFFDKSSNNAALRMQMMFSRGGMQGVDEEVELRRFKGIEYVVVHDDAPGLFIVHKRFRESPNEAHTLSAYHILNDSIYEAPSLYQVVNERLLTSLHALSTSLSLLRSHKPTWTAEGLGRWEIRSPSSSSPPTDRSSSSWATKGIKRSHSPENLDSTTTKEDTIVVEEREAGMEEEEALPIRPSETFNPLLFRALGTVSKALASSNSAISFDPSATTTTTTVQNGMNHEEEEKKGFDQGKGVVVDAAGKRVPRKVLQAKAQT